MILPFHLHIRGSAITGMPSMTYKIQKQNLLPLYFLLFFSFGFLKERNNIRTRSHNSNTPSNLLGIFTLQKLRRGPNCRKHGYTNEKLSQFFYQMMLGQSSQRIPSVIAGKIQSHQEVQGHHRLVLPNQSKRI